MTTFFNFIYIWIATCLVILIGIIVAYLIHDKKK